MALVLGQCERFKETTEEDLCVGCYLLDLLGVFVADEDNYWINVNTVEPFDGVRGNVEQTVAALHPKKPKQSTTLAGKLN